ncbi:MAG: lysophospholipid acyltransferase family protein [Syntrophales bacterium LBB04]|nr:lysophospholipid acyltransferase family protein [Syntrophales bacterium LBB04]
MQPQTDKSLYNPIHLTIRCFQVIPLWLRKAIFIALLISFYHLFRRHRLIAMHNLKTSFPKKNMSEIIILTKKAYLNVAIVAAEFFNIPNLTRNNIEKLVDAHGLEKCEEALKRGKGLITISAHFGNWELAAVAFSIYIKPVLVPYRPLDNSFLDDLIYHVRSSTGNKLIPKEKSIRPMLRALQKNEIIGILLDQNMAKNEGVFVEYFQRPACTTDSLAQLAMLTCAPVFPIFLLRTNTGKYRFIVGVEI